MTVQDLLAQLEPLGHEKVRAHNARYGAGSNQFGVKLGDLRTLAKQIKTNHPLAMELWQTGNFEARLLAILIMKPALLSADELEALVQSEKATQVADWLSAYLIKDHKQRDLLRERWMQSSDTMCARAGWSLTSGKVARDPAGLDFAALLDRLEAEMPHAAPEVQWTMNSTLANIGIHFPELRQRAIDIGEKHGIYRDYPVSKGCTSPFAPIWIHEMVKRQG